MAVFIHGVCVCVDFLHDFPVSPDWREHRLNCWRKSTFCASCIWYKFLALARPWCWVFIFTVFTVVAPDFPSHLKPSSPDFLSHVIIDDPTKGAPWGHSWLPSSPFNFFFFFLVRIVIHVYITPSAVKAKCVLLPSQDQNHVLQPTLTVSSMALSHQSFLSFCLIPTISFTISFLLSLWT